MLNNVAAFAFAHKGRFLLFNFLVREENEKTPDDAVTFAARANKFLIPPATRINK